MGIPSYFAYIIRNHKKIIGKLDVLTDSTKTDTYVNMHNLYLDCNSIIYDALQKHDQNSIDNDYEANIIKNVCRKIDEYISVIKPSDNIFIAFDGIPPVAKLSQQKNRRYKSWYQNHIFNIVDKWDTANITPGTPFMNRLNNDIQKYFKNGASKYNVKNMIVSCSDEPGEGEHKIYNYIRCNSIQHKETNTVIYGLDADLIMLSLNHLHYCKNIYLYREAPVFISSLDSELNPDEHYLLNMGIFRSELHNIMMNEYNIQKGADECIRDYIFMCFLLGNDFMPHFPALNIRTNGIDLLLQLYKTLFGNNNKTLVCEEPTKNGIGENSGITNIKICWKNLKLFIKQFGDNEEELLINIYKNREKMERRIWPESEELDKRIDKFINIPVQSRTIERFINPRENGWRWRYYKSVFGKDITVDSVKNEWLKDLCINYLETLEWTYKYYTIGCVDWQFNYVYNYPPLFQDLVHYIPYFDNEFLGEQAKYNPLDVRTTLAYVLPNRSLHMMDSEFVKKLLKEWPDYYRTDYEFQWAFCRYFWECHVEFPPIDINKFNESVKSY